VKPIHFLCDGLVGGAALLFGILACTPAQDANLKQAENLVLTDLENGSTLEVIETAMAALVPAGTDVDEVINLIIGELIDFNQLPAAVLPAAVAIQSSAFAKWTSKKLILKAPN
jgi:hypothetical protein